MITLENQPLIRPVLSRSEELAIAPLVLAFANDPAVRWMYPDPHQYRTFFPRFARAFGGKAFEHATAQALDGYRGTALWLPAGVLPDENRLIPLLQQTVAPARLDELLAVFEQMAAHHPSVPHWHLALLGVDPRHQRQGLGSVLIAPMLATFDLDGTVAYLEASQPENVPFYERHGFEVRGEIQAGTSPTLYAMVREPR